ncbi:MAG: tRNA guanosine(34) transglycosylase Tgt [bacterium]|nr:tRNA guanosine(34) transglycosylase Tgt [bacterium]
MFKFKIENRVGKARTGVLKTSRGKVATPNIATVATHGKIRILNKTDHKRANPDLLIANTFHLWVNNKVKEIRKAGGIHKWNRIKKPTMTDSGGFQVFSLGWGKTHKVGKVAKGGGLPVGEEMGGTENSAVKITDGGVVFKYENREYKLDAEKSMKIQRDIGADIIFAFDECTSPAHSRSYNEKSLIKTHAWAERSLAEHKKLNARALKGGGGGQALFGIVQGGIFEDLRKKSSKFIGSMDFDGFGIGGSFGEKEMGKVIGWALDGLPDEKPRHLLGIGKIGDIFTAVERGIDLFDCVIPTREARHGVLYTKGGRMSIGRSIFGNDNKLIERGCGCFACANKIKRKDIRQMFKTDKDKARRLATIHNIHFYKTLFREIRETIAIGKGFEKLKKEYGVG